jgi:hypothetical protein
MGQTYYVRKVGVGPEKKKFDPPGPATPLMASLVPRFA